MKKVFVCSPFKGNVEENTKLARRVAHFLMVCRYLPVAPHLYFPQFMMDSDPYERIRAIKIGVTLMESCDMLWLIAPPITSGMAYELEAAKRLQIPVEMYDHDMNRIPADTLLLDDRVDDDFRAKVEGLNFGKAW